MRRNLLSWNLQRVNGHGDRYGQMAVQGELCFILCHRLADVRRKILHLHESFQLRAELSLIATASQPNTSSVLDNQLLRSFILDLVHIGSFKHDGPLSSDCVAALLYAVLCLPRGIFHFAPNF